MAVYAALDVLPGGGAVVVRPIHRLVVFRDIKVFMASGAVRRCFFAVVTGHACAHQRPVLFGAKVSKLFFHQFGCLIEVASGFL